MAKPEVHYLIRYLPPKEAGLGEVVFATSCALTPDEIFNHLRETKPEIFERSGFYSLMRAAGETLTVNKEPNHD